MLWTVLLTSALAGPSVDVRLERPLVHKSAWRIVASDGELSPQTAFWDIFAGTALGFGGRRGTSWVADLELGSRRVRWTRKTGVKEFGSGEVWGGGQLAWRRGLTGPRTDVAWPWVQAGAGWSFGNNGTRQIDYSYTPFQGPAAHAELGLELPGQSAARPFLALRMSGHAGLFVRHVRASCSQLSTCYGLDGNSSAWRLGLQLGVRMGEPPEPWEEPEVIEGAGPIAPPEEQAPEDAEAPEEPTEPEADPAGEETAAEPVEAEQPDADEPEADAPDARRERPDTEPAPPPTEDPADSDVGS